MADENKEVKIVDLDECANGDGKKIKVDRRSPISFLNINKRYGINHIRDADPKLKDNPLRGRLLVSISTTSIILFVFIGELIFNKLTFNGRCLSKVLYPKYDTGHMPYIVSIGYGACEHNLQVDAAERVFFGYGATDQGWPTTLVEKTIKLYSDSSWDSPSERVYGLLGGLDTNMIRNYGENFRLFWSMFMHGSWKHLLFNVLSQLQILWIIEPDWGFYRTISLFILGGLGGNLSSAVFDPCDVTVGSSGALYGLYGALLPYFIEYWNTLPHPLLIILFWLISILIGLFTGLTSFIDNYAHLGGCIVGLLWGFTTIRSVSSCDKCTVVERILLSPIWSWMLTSTCKTKLQLAIIFKKERGDKRRQEYEVKKKLSNNSSITHKQLMKLKKKFDHYGSPPFRMRLREWIVRVTSLALLASIFSILCVFLYKPELYTKFKPPGQLKLNGWISCHCCFITNMDKLAQLNDLGYKPKDLYWCWRDLDTAKRYCGDFEESGLNILESLIVNAL